MKASHFVIFCSVLIFVCILSVYRSNVKCKIANRTSSSASELCGNSLDMTYSTRFSDPLDEALVNLLMNSDYVDAPSSKKGVLRKKL